MKGWKIEAAIVALGLYLLGYMINCGINDFKDKERIVSAKGLSEMEVKADKVRWPLVYKKVGNDPVEMYNLIEKDNNAIISFLKSRGIKDEEIIVAPPQLYDQQAETYTNETVMYRYKATCVITVTSKNVDLVRKLIKEQTVLMKQGIALVSNMYGGYSVNYEFTGLNSIKPQMIEEATKNARNTAEKFAKDSDSKLGKIVTAHQGQFSIEDRDENTPWIKNVRVVTTIDYYLKN